MSKLPAVFDFGSIRDNLNKLENKNYTETLPERIPPKKKSKVILSTKDIEPSTFKTLNKIDAIFLIDMQIHMTAAGMPTSCELWRQIRKLVDYYGWED